MRKDTSNYDLQVDAVRELFLSFDQETMIQKYSLSADSAYLYLTFLHTPYRIDRLSGRVDEMPNGTWQECRSYNTVMTIYDLLCYHQGRYAPTLSHTWCPVSSFTVAGSLKDSMFTQTYAKLFDSDIPHFHDACIRQGGTILPAIAGADLSCRFPVTDFFPILLQFWRGDEEFPPKLLFLWDRSSMHFLHFETTFFLVGDLLSRLKTRFGELTQP